MRPVGYEFAPGSHFQAGAHRNPEAVGAHVDSLKALYGKELTAEIVVEDARDPASPIHSFFEWDDTVAAEQYRLHQARGLIRAVVGRYAGPEGQEKRIRAFVHVPAPPNPHYRPVEQAMSEAETRDLVLQRAWRELQEWRQRYADLKEFSELIQAITGTTNPAAKTVRR